MRILASVDPMAILHRKPKIWISIEAMDLAMALRKAVVIGCAIAIGMSLVGIILSNNPQGVAENKQTITGKLIIIFVISNLVLIFNWLYGVMHSVAGWG